MGLSLVIPVANNHAIDQVIEQFPRHPKFSNIPPNRDGDSTKNAANVLFVKVSQQKLEEFDSTTNFHRKKPFKNNYPKSSSHTWCLAPLKALCLKKIERGFIHTDPHRTMQSKNKQNKQTWNWSVPCTSLCRRVISPTRNGPSFLCEPGYVVDSEDGFAKQKKLKNWKTENLDATNVSSTIH